MKSLNKPTTLTILSLTLTTAFVIHVFVTTWFAIKQGNWEVVNANGQTLKDITLGGVIGYFFVRSHQDKPATT